MALKEYKPGAAFPGRMGRTLTESEPAWPAPLLAREGAANVLFDARLASRPPELGNLEDTIRRQTRGQRLQSVARRLRVLSTQPCGPAPA